MSFMKYIDSMNRILREFKINKKIKTLGQYHVFPVILFPFFITILLEMLSRRSIVKGFVFIKSNPIMFLVNVLIILLSLSFTMLFPRRTFYFILVSAMWLGLGIANDIILHFRSTPLTAMDFYIFKSVKGVIRLYLNKVQIILFSVTIGVFILTMVLLWKKIKKSKILIKVPLCIFSSTAILMLVLSTVAYKVNALSNNYGNLPDAYTNYGFAYCFSNSVFDRGIRKPDNYSKEEITEVLEDIENESAKIYSTSTFNNTDLLNDPLSGVTEILSTQSKDSPDTKTNIIMVQLESFFDVNHLLNYTFSENPIPNFTHLKGEYSSGSLMVPAYGAGTINTEFEVLTGMNTKYFGTGEYPYRTILRSTTCESVPYNLQELGYHSYAIHNNTATFYDRKNILQKLGFDNFDSIEYMNNVSYNSIGWAKDRILTNEIVKALNADEASEFIYTISVQPHGKYPDTLSEEDQKIKVIEKPNEDKSPTEKNSLNKYKLQLEYYVNQLAETDQFVRNLTDVLSDYQEPTVVVFFGDHLPPLSLHDKNLINNDRFQTEYILWSNYPMDNVKQDLSAYQLSAYLMERLGYENGTLTKLHQRCIGDTEYQKNLKLLQYDMLYGNHYVYDGINPFVEKPMQLGISETEITDVVDKEDMLFCYGKNFTPWSMVYIGEKPRKTTFINQTTLSIPYENVKGKELTVAQVTKNNIILSKSKAWKAE